MPTKYTFYVQGSSEKPYKVVFSKVGDLIKATCDCMAGKNGQHCRHRFDILAGKIKEVVGGDLDRITELSDWLTGSNVEEALIELHRIEEKVKQEIKIVRQQSVNARLALAETLRGKPYEKF